MDNVSVIDRFLDVFSRYIDSGFGLLAGEVAFLTATLVAIDMTLAGLFWAMGHAAGGSGEDVMARFLRKVLYVGAFAFILNNFNALAGVVFRSFAGLGLLASGASMPQSQLLQPGRLARVGIDAGAPLMAQISDLAGFPEVFAHFDVLVVLLLAWLVLILTFFVLAVQLFVTLIEFKLTTLAGFVLVPFALWNRTAFLAERVLGNVVSSGVKVLVLAVIVGIGSGLFNEFALAPGEEPSIDHALVIMLASLAMLGLGIYGPAVATGLVAGAPQLGAGAAAGTAMGATGAAVGSAAALAGAGSAVAAAARLAPGAASSGAAPHAAHGAQAPSSSGSNATSGASASAATFAQPAKPPGGHSATAATAAADNRSASAEPAWARQMRRRQQIAHAATTVAHTLRSGDQGGNASGPSLRDDPSS